MYRENSDLHQDLRNMQRQSQTDLHAMTTKLENVEMELAETKELVEHLGFENTRI